MPHPSSDDRQARQALTTLGAYLDYHAVHRPDRTALYYNGQTLSYAEWQAKANRIANALIATGSPRQARIGYLGKNDSRFLEVLMGCAKAAMVLTPLSWRLALPEILLLLNDFDTECLILDREFLPILDEIRAARPSCRTFILIEAEAEGAENFDAWRDRHSAIDPGVSVSSDDVVAQIHTSGTTGRPKGVMLSHGNLLNVARHADTGEITPFSENDIALVTLPLFHSGGICWTLYVTFVGGAAFITRAASSSAILEALYSVPITKAGFVPALIQMVIDDPAFDRTRMSALKVIAYGGSPITVDLLRRCIDTFGCDFIQFYGMTESSAIGTALRPEDHDLSRPERLASCGRPLHDIELKIVGPDGNELPHGEIGEIMMRGGSVMKGYYGKPEATAEVLKDGWYRSGDAGHLDEAGYLYVRDRIKDMIISGGENIYPAEVETAIASHAAVQEVGVIGVPSSKWGEAVMAFVVLRKGTTATAEEIIAHCRTQIASFKAPKAVEFIELLPRNASGKILKRELRAAYGATASAGGPKA